MHHHEIQQNTKIDPVKDAGAESEASLKSILSSFRMGQQWQIVMQISKEVSLHALQC